MSAQMLLPIADRVRASLESAAADIRAEMRAIAKRTKQGDVLARAAGVDAGNFSKALKGERQLDVDTLPAFFYADEGSTLIRLLCRLNRGKFIPDPEITADMRIENILRSCRRSGAAGEAILRDAGEDV